MNEFVSKDIREVKQPNTDNFRLIRPKKELSFKELIDAVNNEFSKAASETNDINENAESPSSEKNLDPSHKECLTTSEERQEMAGHSKGEWDGETGNSRFYPEKEEAREALKEYQQDGIEYKDGEPDFSKVSEATVRIDDMTSSRPGNFMQANERCAELWNEIKKDGRSDWTARTVEDWREKNRYSWHERLDMRTMDLVQRDVHEECKHYGGVSECRKHEALNGGGFDE